MISPDYEAFCRAKLVVHPPTGIANPPPMPEWLFPFQQDLVRWALERGRAALFADAGMGKTRCQLAWAHAVAEHTGGRVLILAPLAVAPQTVREGADVGVHVTPVRDPSQLPARGIVITNYEMAEKFDPALFAGVVLDESSVLKNYMGARKRFLVESFRSTPFRLCASATPAPNDHLELGNHADFLGVLSSHEMIARWFINDSSTFGTYRLKGHAVASFWDWVNSWARCVGKPSDVRSDYDDSRYCLPGLRIQTHVLDVDVVAGRGEGQLFRDHKMSAASLHREKRITVRERVAKVAELVAAEPDETWCVWCETDYEADALKLAIPEAVEVRGSHTIATKEERLNAFSDGRTRVLITKARIAGAGLNWQHCARVVYVAPSFSYESDYQSLRRFHRFGQAREVVAHYVMAHTEVDVWAVMLRKAQAHEAMKLEMFAATRRAAENRDDGAHWYEPKHMAKIPAWLRSERIAS